MRGWVIALLCTTACGRIGFDASGDGGAAGDDAPGGDGGLTVPSSELYIKASNTDAGDRFGQSVSLSADGMLLAVGAYQEASSATGVGGNQTDDTMSGAGAVYLFSRVPGGTWMQSTYIKSSNPNNDDQFGFTLSLAADGHTLAVVAPLEASSTTGINGVQTDNGAAASGAVYVFSDAGGGWAQQAYIKASNTGASDQFGYSIGLSADGNTLAVGGRLEDSGATGIGASQNDNSVMDAGALYIFTRTGTMWSQQAYIKPSVTSGGNEFGRAVAISGDGNTVVSCATYDKSNATGVDGDDTNTLANASGGCYVFVRSGTTWKQQNYLKASNTNQDDSFGWSASISSDGQTIAIGSLVESSAATGVNGDQSNNAAAEAGAVYVFARVGNSWTQEAYVKAPNADAQDHFGFSIALSGDGNGLVVAANAESSNATGIDGAQNNNATSQSGAVYVYTRSAGQWTYRAYLKATNTDATDRFGTGLALAASARVIACGSALEDSASSGIGNDGTNNTASAAGAVYVFQ